MRSGQSIEYNTKNIFLKKSYTKRGGDTIPRPFSNISKFSISLDQQSKSFKAGFQHADFSASV